MQYYKIEFTINFDGSVTERVIASGSNCTAVTQELEKAMGEIRSQELLPEAMTETITEDETLWASHS
ncbi:DUF2997 domain-containing protein [Microcoleus sp. D3_18a_C4]|uniref:DUF2997 domain-containing protein n=1 Tax=unclassified Microcoleus TaxID=2642155 RepID=UPI002FD2D9BF